MNQTMNQTWLSNTDYIPETAEEAETTRAEEGVKGGEFNVELTAGGVYDSLQERLALARTRALMGERVAALDLLGQAHADYETYKDTLQGFPLHALEHAFTVTMELLCAEKGSEAKERVAEKRTERNEETPLAFTSSEALSEPVERGGERKGRSRKRASKAA